MIVLMVRINSNMDVWGLER